MSGLDPYLMLVAIPMSRTGRSEAHVDSNPSHREQCGPGKDSLVLGTVLQAEKVGLKMLRINSIKITSDVDDLKVFTRHYT